MGLPYVQPSVFICTFYITGKSENIFVLTKVCFRLHFFFFPTQDFYKPKSYDSVKRKVNSIYLRCGHNVAGCVFGIFFSLVFSKQKSYKYTMTKFLNKIFFLRESVTFSSLVFSCCFHVHITENFYYFFFN